MNHVLCYLRTKLLQVTVKPVEVLAVPDTSPPCPPQLLSLNQKLTAAPSGPHVSGRVIQAEGISPRSTYWL